MKVRLLRDRRPGTFPSLISTLPCSTSTQLRFDLSKQWVKSVLRSTLFSSRSQSRHSFLRRGFGPAFTMPAVSALNHTSMIRSPFSWVLQNPSSSLEKRGSCRSCEMVPIFRIRRPRPAPLWGEAWIFGAR